MSASEDAFAATDTFEDVFVVLVAFAVSDTFADASGKRSSPAVLPSARNRTVSYTHLRAHETRHDLVCRLLLEKKKRK